jgi:nicotinate-nucleotide adenylyltransferase
VGLLGGTFDPIHLGHLAAAQAAQQALRLDSVRFVPAARPPHRPDSPRADEYHRVEMIRRAIADAAGWEVSDLELHRDGPSYTWDTLVTLHAQGFSPLQIFFITGADAFAEITTWYRYPDVLDAAHFAVLTRPGVSLDVVRQRVPDLVPRMIRAEDIASAGQTRIIPVEANTPDVSSTDIRARVAAGLPIEKLVPLSVAAYIRDNVLYASAAGASASARVSDERELRRDRAEAAKGREGGPRNDPGE